MKRFSRANAGFRKNSTSSFPKMSLESREKKAASLYLISECVVKKLSKQREVKAMDYQIRGI